VTELKRFGYGITKDGYPHLEREMCPFTKLEEAEEYAMALNDSESPFFDSEVRFKVVELLMRPVPQEGANERIPR